MLAMVWAPTRWGVEVVLPVKQITDRLQRVNCGTAWGTAKPSPCYVYASGAWSQSPGTEQGREAGAGGGGRFKNAAERSLPLESEGDAVLVGPHGSLSGMPQPFQRELSTSSIFRILFVIGILEHCVIFRQCLFVAWASFTNRYSGINWGGPEGALKHWPWTSCGY